MCNPDWDACDDFSGTHNTGTRPEYLPAMEGMSYSTVLALMSEAGVTDKDLSFATNWFTDQNHNSSQNWKNKNGLQKLTD